MLPSGPRWIATVLVAVSAGCGYGIIVTGDSDASVSVSPSDGDTCEGDGCSDGDTCEGDDCLPIDSCEGVTCSADEVCQYGVCISVNADTDGDEFSAPEDCNDRDPSIYPGAEETCNNRDDDCDGEIDEGIEERDCSNDCGSGTETCESGQWHCSAPDPCECLEVGLTEERECGQCGTQRRTCQEDNSWSDWTACEGNGDCSECGDGQCDDNEDCNTCAEDCGDCVLCPATDHMGEGENDDPCSDPAEMWRCVFSNHFSDWISQVCRDGVWVTYHINPRDCEECCEDYSQACEAH